MTDPLNSTFDILLNIITQSLSSIALFTQQHDNGI